MLLSYLTIVLRNLQRHRFYALLNLIGLSIGVSCFLVAAIYTHKQLSYNTQHENLDRIYRVVREVTDSGGTRFDIGTRAVGSYLADAFPEVKHAVKILNRPMFVSTELRGFNEMVAVSTPNIREVFTYPLVSGDPTSLATPGSAFITEYLASKLFGDQDPIGQPVRVD